MAYDAFVSYSHAGDAAVATALERGLERLARPWYRIRALSVFRDQSGLALTPDLWRTISVTLDESRHLILLASPESAASEWVGRELTHWCEDRGTDGLLLVLTGGTIEWDAQVGDFTAASTAVPAALRGRFGAEPLHHDLRWARDAAELSLRESRFRSAVVHISATMRGVSPEDLEGEDVRLHRRARRLARAAVATVTVLALVASAAAVVAVRNARRADRRAREAIARQVGLEALDEPASALDRALLLSLAAAQLDTDAQDPTRPGRMLVGRYSRLDRMLQVPAAPGAATSVRGLALSGDGTEVAVTAVDAGEGGAGGELLRWHLGAGPGAEPETVAAPAGPLAFLGGSGGVVVGAPGDAPTVIGASAALPPAPEARLVALRPAADRAVVGDGERLALVELATGRRLAELPGGVTAALTDDVTVLAGAGRLAAFDTRDGTALGSSALPDGSGVVTAAVGGAVLTWTPAGTGTVRLQRWEVDGGLLTPAGDPVTAPVPAPREAVLATGGARLLVVSAAGAALVDTVTGAVIARDPEAVGAATGDPSGRFVALAGGRFAVWDLAAGQRVLAVPQPVGAVAWAGSCSATDGCRLVTAGRSLDVWDALARRHIPLAADTNAQVVAISGDGSTVVSAGWGAAVAVWRIDETADDTGRTELTGPGGATAHDAATGTTARLADGTLEVTRAGSTERFGVGPGDRVELLSRGRRALVVGDTGVELRDVGSGREVALDPLCRAPVVATSPDRSLVASYRARDRAVGVCDAGTGARRLASALDGAVDPVSAIAVSDDGDIAIGGGDGLVARYAARADRLGDGVAIDVRFGGEAVAVTSLALGRRRLAAGLAAADETVGRVLLWDVGGRGEPIEFEVDRRRVLAVALLGPGDDLLAVGGDDGDGGPASIQVSEAASRRLLGRPLRGPGAGLAFLGGTDSEVVAVGGDGRAYRWPVDRDTRREICGIVGRDLRRDEWEGAVGGALPDDDYDPQCR